MSRRLKAALNGKWIHDGCRHTGATYYNGKYGVTATAELLAHQTTALVRRHYAGVVTRADAEAFLALGPDSVPPPPTEPAVPRPKYKWTKEELARLVTEKTLRQIARDAGCSDVWVHKKCVAFGIPTPGRGCGVTQKALGAPSSPQAEDSGPPESASGKKVVTESSLPENSPAAPRETNQPSTDAESDNGGSIQKPPETGSSGS